MVYRFEGTDFFDGLQQTPPSTGVDRLLIRMGSCDTTFDLSLAAGQVCSRGEIDEGVFDFEAAASGFPQRPAPQPDCIVPLMSGDSGGIPNGYSGGAYQIRDAGALESFEFGVGGVTKAFPWNGYIICWASGKITEAVPETIGTAEYLKYFIAEAGTLRIYGAYDFQHAVCLRGEQCVVSSLDGVQLRVKSRLRVVELDWTTNEDPCLYPDSYPGVSMTSSGYPAGDMSAISEESTNGGKHYSFGQVLGEGMPMPTVEAPAAVYGLCWCNAVAWTEAGEGDYVLFDGGQALPRCQSEGYFSARVGHMHVVQRLGCVQGEACFVPVLKSLLMPVDDYPDVGAYLRGKSDENNPPPAVPLNDTFKVEAFALFLRGSAEAECNARYASAADLVESAQGLLASPGFWAKHGLEAEGSWNAQFRSAVRPDVDDSVAIFERSAKFPEELGQSGEYDLCSVLPDLSLADVNLHRKQHHLLASDFPPKARALMVCPANSDFSILDGECKCRAGLYMQYTDRTEQYPVRCVICAGDVVTVPGTAVCRGDVCSSEEPAADEQNLGYFCPPGSKENDVLSNDVSISQKCRFAKGVGFTTVDFSRTSSEDCLCQKGRKFLLGGTGGTCQECEEGLFKDTVGNLDTCPGTCMRHGSSDPGAPDILDCFCNPGKIINIGASGDPECLPCPPGRFCTGGVKARKAEVVVQHTLDVNFAEPPLCSELKLVIAQSLGLDASLAQDIDLGTDPPCVEDAARRAHALVNKTGRRLAPLKITLPPLSGDQAASMQNSPSYDLSAAGGSVSGEVGTAMSEEDFYNSLPDTAGGGCNDNAAAQPGAQDASGCQCVEGYTERLGATDDRGVRCQTCGKGYYKGFVGNDPCTSCFAGETTIQDDARNSTACICESGRYRASPRATFPGGNNGSSFCVECGCDTRGKGWGDWKMPKVISLDNAQSQAGLLGGCSIPTAADLMDRAVELKTEGKDWCNTEPSWCLLSGRLRSATGDPEPCEQDVVRSHCDKQRGEYFCSHAPATLAIEQHAGSLASGTEPVPVQCPPGMRRSGIKPVLPGTFIEERVNDCMCRPGWRKVMTTQTPPDGTSIEDDETSFSALISDKPRRKWRVRIAGIRNGCAGSYLLACKDVAETALGPDDMKSAVKLSTQPCGESEEFFDTLIGGALLSRNHTSLALDWDFDLGPRLSADSWRVIRCVYVDRQLIAPENWISEGYVSLEAYMENENKYLRLQYPRYAVPEAVAWWRQKYDEIDYGTNGGPMSFWAPVGLWWYVDYLGAQGSGHRGLPVHAKSPALSDAARQRSISAIWARAAADGPWRWPWLGGCERARCGAAERGAAALGSGQRARCKRFLTNSVRRRSTRLCMPPLRTRKIQVDGDGARRLRRELFPRWNRFLHGCVEQIGMFLRMEYFPGFGGVPSVRRL
jgi:hypothetical protein